MGVSGRAFRALLLLIGFYMLGFGLLLLLLGLDVGLGLAGLTGPGLAKVCFASLVIAIPIVRGIFFTRGNRLRKPPGLPVHPHQQPLLWQRVRVLAAQVGTRPPREIRLTADVNAFVHENARMAGLLPGRRRLFVGVPLLIGLTPAQLDAVLCHELGHYSNKDTRLASLVHRGRESMLNTVRMFAGKRVGNQALYQLYRRYAEHYLRTTEAISRQQELAADRVAVRVAGRDNTAGALRQLPALEAGFDFYLRRYAVAGAEIGLRPVDAEFLGGFRHLLADPQRSAELDELREDIPEQEPQPFDSHPPLAHRIADVEALPDDGRGRDSGTATSLLYDPAALFAAVSRKELRPETAGLQQVDWPTLLHSTARARVLEAARPLLETAGSLAAVLDLLDAGGFDRLADGLPEPSGAAGTRGRVRAEHLRTDLDRRLLALCQLTLADGGRGGWPLSWSGPGVFEAAGVPAERLREAVHGAVAPVPVTGPLRALMALPAPAVHPG